MLLNESGKRGENLADALRTTVAAAPWFMLGVMYEMESTQWERLRTQETYTNLLADIGMRVRKSLEQYPLHTPSAVEDATTDVLLKLFEGSFLRNFNEALGLPRPYMLGCARQLSRVVARSLWRQHLRDNGLPPMKRKENSDPALGISPPQQPPSQPRPLALPSDPEDDDSSRSSERDAA